MAIIRSRVVLPSRNLSVIGRERSSLDENSKLNALSKKFSRKRKMLKAKAQFRKSMYLSTIPQKYGGNTSISD